MRISLMRSSLMRSRAEMMLTWSTGAVASGSAILLGWLGVGGAFGSAIFVDNRDALGSLRLYTLLGFIRGGTY